MLDDNLEPPHYEQIDSVMGVVNGSLWCYKKTDANKVNAIMHRYGVSHILSTILASRQDLCLDTIDAYLNPKIKHLMPPIAEIQDSVHAANLVWDAYENNHKIGIFGDYDVDGVASMALLLSYFSNIGMDDPLVYIPDRVYEGYGLNKDAIDYFVARKADLLIVVDCGSNDIELIAYAQEKGLQIIVIDHHIISVNNEADAFINPKRPDDNSGLENLCAAGLVFVFLAALNFAHKQKHHIDKEVKIPDIRQYLDFVCLATIADIVPLTGLNRAFVKAGLKVLDMRNNPSLAHMLDAIHVENRGVTTRDIGFKIAPLLNAAGRMASAIHALDFLCNRNNTPIHSGLSKLVEYNTLRQKTYNSIVDEASAQLLFSQPHQECLFLDQMNWHKGVIGTVASYFSRRHNVPCFITSWQENGIGVGSVRSVENCDVGVLLGEAKRMGLLISGGGHSMAGGFTLNKSHYISFKNMICSKIKADKNVKQELQTQRYFDVILSLQALTVDLYEAFTVMEPFGKDNPHPLIMLRDVYFAYAKIVGKRHISCYIGQDNASMIKAISFNSVGTQVEHALMQPNEQKLSVIGTLEKDVWKNKEKCVFHIEDIIVN